LRDSAHKADKAWENTFAAVVRLDAIRLVASECGVVQRLLPSIVAEVIDVPDEEKILFPVDFSDRLLVAPDTLPPCNAGRRPK
jgi:hypothetical protein